MNNQTDWSTAGTTTTGANAYTDNNCYYYWSVCYPPVTYIHATEPSTCIGKAHVFECDHVATCKCGKIRKVMKGK